MSALDWVGFIPADPQDIDRMPPADLDTCPTCLGAGALQGDPRDPADVVVCHTCDGARTLAGAA